MNDKKNLLFTITNGWGVRNYVDTGLLNKLSAIFNVTVLTTENYANYLRSVLDVEISIESLSYVEPRYISFLRRASKYLLQVKFSIETKKIKDKYTSSSKTLMSVLCIFDFMVRVFFPRSLLLFISDLRYKFYSNKHIESFYKDNQVDVVVNGSPFDPLDNAFLSPSYRNGITSICLIPSWDNPSTKGVVFSCHKRIIVWGNAQKNELIDYYGDSSRNKIFVGGVLQHDFYENDSYESNHLFKSRLEIDQNRKIILLATGSDKLTPNEFIIANKIVEWINSTPEYDLHLIVRCHPMDDYRKYQHLADQDRVTIFPSSSCDGNLYRWIPLSDEIYTLKSMIKNSILTINTASTMTLDSLACGVSVLNLAFDCVNDNSSEKSVNRFYKYTHYNVITQSGVVPIILNEKQLFEKIEAYVKGIDCFTDAEVKLYDNICGKFGESVDSHVEIICSSVM